MTARHAAVLLAAGASRRLGTAKQLLMIDGEPLVRRAARALLATQPCTLLVVVGARADDVYAAVADLPAQRVDCEGWAEGLAASLRAGVGSLPQEADAALVALCDQPAMDAAHLSALVAAWNAQRASAVASAYAGVLGVPAVLPRAWFDDISTLHGDAGARELLRSRAEDVIGIEAPQLERDVDEPRDRTRLRHRP